MKYPQLFCLLLSSYLLSIHICSPAKENPLLVQQSNLEEAQDELSRLDVLIQCTQKNLERQQVLRNHISEFRTIEQACISNPKDTTKMYQLTQTAKKVLELSFVAQYPKSRTFH